MSTTDQNYDNILTGSLPATVQYLTLATGTLLKGTILGVLTEGGNLKASSSASSDGSQVPKYILKEDADASVAPVPCVVYETGSFNADKLICVNESDTVASFQAALRTQGIHIFPVVDSDTVEAEESSSSSSSSSSSAS